ncbi:hypothetical protein D9758_010400 [Tetrapyrgos nigripes]|uniref:Coenzyme Q-binding protein COQ10 START domain-containing protein n=1 Tax=Tetrapyrgos nigripes TaxID=182062 RepID=A0A8H5D090_9AGAR|nr:hypothetical protein D9758_010400 [Tetrapyrgos nigripes]
MLLALVPLRIVVPMVLLVQRLTPVSAQSSPPSHLPPVNPGLFSAHASILINGTVQEVWDVLTDFPAYREWNPFVRSALVTNSLLIPTSSQTPAENLRLILNTQIPPLSLPVNASSKDNLLNTRISIENITKFEPDSHRIAWELLSPDFLLSAVRWSAVSKYTDENWTTWTFYESREVFDGVLSSITQSLQGKGVQEGFEAQAEALKRRVEGA